MDTRDVFTGRSKFVSQTLFQLPREPVTPFSVHFVVSFCEEGSVLSTARAESVED